jgi:hypothetical protein
MVYRYYDSVRFANEYSDWNNLANTLLVLGLDWKGSTQGDYAPTHSTDKRVPKNLMDPSSTLSLAGLLKNYNKLSNSARSTLALAFLLRPTQAPRDKFEEVVDEVAEGILSSLRLQGRTAYLPISSSSPTAAPMRDQATALSLLSLYNPKHPFVQKLAAYVAEGNSNAGSYYSWDPQTKALTSLALSDYDSLKGNTDPNLNLKVTSAQSTLLDATFTSAEDPVETQVVKTEEMPKIRTTNGKIGTAPINFSAKGKGEAGVSLTLDFVPSAMSQNPTYRGIFVERLVQKIDQTGGATGKEGTGPNTQVSQSGNFVLVTLQVTTPDDLVGVYLEDLLPGGLEASDPHLANAPVSHSPKPMSMASRWCFWCYRPTFGPQQTEKERVVWYANNLPAGTHTVSYIALANTPGTFLHPPARAYSARQPELMGLSGGTYFVVYTGEEVTNEDDFLSSKGVSVMTSAYPKECAVECMPDESCNTGTGKCEKVSTIYMESPLEISLRGGGGAGAVTTASTSTSNAQVPRVSAQEVAAATAATKASDAKETIKKQGGKGKGSRGKKGKGRKGKGGKGKGGKGGAFRLARLQKKLKAQVEGR